MLWFWQIWQIKSDIIIFSSPTADDIAYKQNMFHLMISVYDHK